VALIVPDALVQAVAERVADLLADRMPDTRVSSAWLDVAGAAERLACPRSRIYELARLGRIPCEREGSRLLFWAADLDAWVRAGGGRRP
jgi:excisionase family DNA binding protein